MPGRRNKAAQRRAKGEGYGVGSPGAPTPRSDYFTSSTATSVEYSEEEEEIPVIPRALPGGLREADLVEILNDKWAPFEEELLVALARTSRSTEKQIYSTFANIKDSIFDIVSEYIQPLVRTFYTLNTKDPTCDVATWTSAAPQLVEVATQSAIQGVRTKHCQTMSSKTEEKFTIIGKKEKLDLLSATCASQTEDSVLATSAPASTSVPSAVLHSAPSAFKKKKDSALLVVKELPKTANLADVQSELGAHGFVCSRLFRLHKNGSSMRTVFAETTSAFADLPSIDTLCGHPVIVERFNKDLKKRKNRNNQKSNSYKGKTTLSDVRLTKAPKADDKLLVDIVKFTKGHFNIKDPATVFNAATKVWNILKSKD